MNGKRTPAHGRLTPAVQTDSRFEAANLLACILTALGVAVAGCGHRTMGIAPDAAVMVCQPAVVISCGATKQGTTVGGPTHIDDYACAQYSDRGPEAYFLFFNPSAATVTVTLDAGSDLDLMVVGESDGACDPDSCVEAGQGVSGNEEVRFSASPSTTYYIVIDTYQTDADTFTLTVTCN